MEIITQALDLLAADGVSVPLRAADRLERHAALVREWNGYASLVSQGDLAHLVPRHTVDALSLAGAVWRAAGAGGLLLDIGSGGGFPALPLKVVLPELPVVLLERSAKKVGVLRRMLVALGLDDVDLRQAEFPRDVAGLLPGVVTARAVERPGLIWRGMAGWLPAGTVFLDQTGDVSGVDRAMFHVEHVLDAWSAAGLRRGELYRVTRR